MFWFYPNQFKYNDSFTYDCKIKDLDWKKNEKTKVQVPMYIHLSIVPPNDMFNKLVGP